MFVSAPLNRVTWIHGALVIIIKARFRATEIFLFNKDAFSLVERKNPFVASADVQEMSSTSPALSINTSCSPVPSASSSADSLSSSDSASASTSLQDQTSSSVAIKDFMLKQLQPHFARIPGRGRAAGVLPWREPDGRGNHPAAAEGLVEC